MLGPPAPLGGVELPGGVDFALEAGEERSPAVRGRLTWITPSVQDVGGQTATKALLARAHVVDGQRGRAALVAHRRGFLRLHLGPCLLLRGGHAVFGTLWA